MASISKKTGAPWHLWVVSLLSLPWNAFGAYDYFMTETGNIAYLEQAGMGPADLAWLAAMPYWATGGWALGVWGAVLGSLLLLARSRWAVTAYVVSIIGIVVTNIWQYSSDRPASMVSTFAIVMTVAIVVLTVAQLWYALRMRLAGVLR